MVVGRLEVDRPSWRGDFAVVQINSKYSSRNGAWHDLPEFLLLFSKMGGNAATFVGKITGAVDSRDFHDGLCYKHSPASRWTVGDFYSHKVELFLKGSTFHLKRQSTNNASDNYSYPELNTTQLPKRFLQGYVLR